MNAIEFEFMRDCQEKKQIGRNIFHRKGMPKYIQVRMPSDALSKGEKTRYKRSGKKLEYNVKTITWDEIQDLAEKDKEAAKRCMQDLIAYQGTRKHVATFFGINLYKLYPLLNKLELVDKERSEINKNVRNQAKYNKPTFGPKENEAAKMQSLPKMKDVQAILSVNNPFKGAVLMNSMDSLGQVLVGVAPLLDSDKMYKVEIKVYEENK